MGKRLRQLNSAIQGNSDDYVLLDNEKFIESKKIPLQNLSLSLFKNDKFYDQGQIDKKLNEKTDKEYVDNNFANAIKQSVSGEVVAVRDVSRIEHNVGCKLTSNSITDFSSVKVTRCNKNLAEKQPSTITIKTAETVLDFKKDVIFPKLTISFDLKNFTSSNVGSALWLINKADGNSVEAKFIPAMKNFGIELNAAPINKHISYSFENMTFSRFRMSYYGGLTGSIENLQIEIGEETPFIEINRAEYMAEPNGMVNGVQSIYPGMILYSDAAGITLNVEYNADTKKYIEDNGGGGTGWKELATYDFTPSLKDQIKIDLDSFAETEFTFSFYFDGTKETDMKMSCGFFGGTSSNLYKGRLLAVTGYIYRMPNGKYNGYVCYEDDYATRQVMPTIQVKPTSDSVYRIETIPWKNVAEPATTITIYGR